MPKPREIDPGNVANEKFLDEEQVGASNTKLGFPNIKGCQAVAVMLSNGVMVGGHFTSGGYEPQMTAAIQAVIARDYPHETVDKMFVAYNSREKTLGAGDVQTKAANFGFQGKVQFFDTHQMPGAKENGTYVELENNGGEFQMRYKRSTKMDYHTGPNFPQSNQAPTVRAVLAQGASKLHSGGDKVKSVRIH